MLNENLSINVTPGGVPVVIHISQYDVGLRTFVFTPYTSHGTFTPDAAVAATLEGTKPDGNIVVQNCQYNATTGEITYTVQEQLAAVVGKVWSKLTLRDTSGNAIGYAAIIWVVDMAGVQDGAIASDSDISALAEFINEFGTINAYKAALDGALAAVGGPYVASTVAQMTDRTKVYVYTGTQTGYTAGHWYYWNGSAWTDGGVYQAAAVETDKTLTVADMAADAKATGDAITELKNDLDNLRERSYNLVDCNDASKWVPTSGKDVTVSIPSADTVRIKSNISQTYAAARYPIDTTGIDTLYAAVGTYTGTGDARARIYGGSSTNLGQISVTGSTFDVSSYDICYIELCATLSTASTGFIDYSMVIVADSAVPVEYKPYYIYKVNELEGAVDQINDSIDNIDTQISSIEDSVSDLNDAIYKTSYNLVDCNDALKWVPRNSNVTITIPAEDTVRVQTAAQTYGTATYAIDVTGIDSLYVSVVSYNGTGQPRAQLTDGSSAIGTINIAGSVFDVSNYNTVYINLAATLSTASEAYVDYYKILAADSTVALPYEPYIDGKESRISEAEETAEEAVKAAGVPQGKFYTIHRGARLTAPENTMPAFILARQMGFRCVETDVRYTSDRVPVLLHDASINRTARNADGSAISETINIADITYAQALTYDFGIYMGQQYTGTKIPTLAEFSYWCKATGTIPVLEQKLRNNPDVDAVIDALINAGITKNFVSLSQGIGSMKRIYDRLPHGKFVLLNTSTITQEIIDDVSESGFIEAIAGLYTSFTPELINACEQADVGLYAHDYYNYSDIYATDDYVSGYIVEEGAI